MNYFGIGGTFWKQKIYESGRLKEGEEEVKFSLREPLLLENQKRVHLVMSDEFAKLSVAEIKAFIERAQIELAVRKHAEKEKVKAEIAQKLQATGLDFADLFPELGGKKLSKKVKTEEGEKAPPKFKDHVSGDTWSGRGPRPPQWVKAIMSQRGWTIEEFKASEEFLAQN